MMRLFSILSGLVLAVSAMAFAACRVGYEVRFAPDGADADGIADLGWPGNARQAVTDGEDVIIGGSFTACAPATPGSTG